MIKQKLGHRIDGWIHSVFPFLFSRPLNPNTLTVVGAVGSLVAAAAFAFGWFAAGGVLILASGFFDLVDGVVARHNGVSTRFGQFLDSTLDRFADMVVLVGIATHFAVLGEPGLVLLTGFALLTGVLVSYSAACAKLVAPSISNIGFLERGERVGILAAGTILGFPVIALWILMLGSLFTLGQRFSQAYREMQSLDEIDRSGMRDRFGMGG
jgi:archaetidylinositol phosphate synthase